jgi:predicted secreted protein
MIQSNLTSKRFRRCAIAGAVLAGALAASAVAAIAAEPDASVPEGATVLHLGDTADRELPRDRLRAQLRVDATGAEAKQVQAEINKRMASAVARAHAAAGVKVETGGYSVYEDRSTNAAARWRGSQTLSLSGGDFAQVLALAGDLQGDGLATSAMVFELAPETARAAQDDLTTEALRRLRQRAERIAADLQMTVLRLSSVHVGNVGGNQPQFPVMMRAMASGVSSQAKMPDPVAEGGDARVEVSVDADVILMPSDQHAP